MAEHHPNHAFFEQMQRDNEKLRDLLGEVTHEFAGGVANADRLAETLGSLAEQLETHFEEEEEAGVFDGVVERAPHMAERVDQLRQQHNDLRAAFAAIQRTAGSGDGTSPWWNDLANSFHDFSTNLMHHETAENAIVLEAYTQDIGAKD